MRLAEVSRQIESGELSPAEHVADVLTRLAGNPYNAVTHLDTDRALRDAKVLTDELAQGHRRGPLHGVAVGIKDIIDVAGMPTRCGSALFADHGPAEHDADIVASLRAAGAVIVAKLHTHEFAYGPTGDIAVEGPCRNPHDERLITGGSSSGSAATVAGGHLPLTIGTDTGGSIRIPASLCGVVGLKPAFGAISTRGVFPLAESLDHVGLFTTDVESAALAWNALTGTAAAHRGVGGGLTVGRPTQAYWAVHDDAIADAVEQAARRLAVLGHRVVEVELPGVEEFPAIYRRIGGAEAFATHADWVEQQPERYQPATLERIQAGGVATTREYIEARRRRESIRTDIVGALAEVDALLVPTTPIRASEIGVLVVDGVDVRAALLSLCSPFNLLGWPAVSVPGAFTPGDRPAGVSVVGVSLDERQLLTLAAGIDATGTRPVAE